MAGKVFEFGPHGLAVLDAFSRPISLSEGLKKLQLQISGTQDSMDLMSTILHLYEAGILHEAEQSKPGLRSDGFGYGAAPIHVAMLNDRTRTSRLIAGIREVVHPGDVVIDIGTGTGILAIAAVRAGAQHVYAIEATGIGKSAMAVFEANEVANRITLIEGWSTQISLPELGDVLISDIIGSEPLAENVLEITADAVNRLLKQDARLLPNRIKIFGLPVTIPRTELMKHTFQERRWKTGDLVRYRFQPIGRRGARFTSYIFYSSSLARDWGVLSEPILLADVDLREVKQLYIDNSVAVTVHTSGRLTASSNIRTGTWSDDALFNSPSLRRTSIASGATYLGIRRSSLFECWRPVYRDL
jgi:hypothetical protein